MNFNATKDSCEQQPALDKSVYTSPRIVAVGIADTRGKNNLKPLKGTEGGIFSPS